MTIAPYLDLWGSMAMKIDGSVATILKRIDVDVTSCMLSRDSLI